jgi:iron(III) transport system substrate-binding protein
MPLAGGRVRLDPRMKLSLALSAVLLVVLAMLPAACRGGGEGAPPAGEEAGTAAAPAAEALTVYSGRNENLIGPLLDRFTAASGIPVEVRYGETAELAATLFEEGEATPAGVFVSQDAAALGALAAAGRLTTLPDDVVGRIPTIYRDPEGR